MGEAIEFKVADLADFQPRPGGGVLVLNPPYGQRLSSTAELAPLYKQIGDVLKRRCRGMEAFIFTVQGELIKSIGLRPARRDILYNGALECRLLHYPLH